jgi:hypothetical protein
MCGEVLLGPQFRIIRSDQRKPMPDKVIAVTANKDFSLDLKFTDGSVKRFDVKPYLDYELFRELKDPNYFKQVRLAFGTVQWPHEQDISPDTLYLESVAVPESPIIDHPIVA